MNTVRFGRWELSCDREATAKAYAAVDKAGPEACACEGCLNFIALRSQVYPAEILALFEELGVSPIREAEVYSLGPLASGKQLYGGWLHFVGTIVSAPDPFAEPENSVYDPEFTFDLDFTTRYAPPLVPLKGLPLVQIEFHVAVPAIIPTHE
jgi:hypothetical protein